MYLHVYAHQYEHVEIWLHTDKLYKCIHIIHMQIYIFETNQHRQIS